MPTPPGQSVLRLRVVLDGVQPMVWRRLLIPGRARLDQVHSMFQAAMGWQDSHLHCFRIGDSLFGMQADDYPDDELDETSVTLTVALGDASEFSYEYDFGDGWEHTVEVEDRSQLPLRLRFGVCVAGENACPPEDCGGAPGYVGLLAVLAQPNDEEHDDLLEWLGGTFDPTQFDLAVANARLQSVR